MWSVGAESGEPSYDLATLFPLPLMIRTIALFLCHDGWFVISSIIKARFVVCWSVPLSPGAFQAGGVHSM